MKIRPFNYDYHREATHRLFAKKQQRPDRTLWIAPPAHQNAALRQSLSSSGASDHWEDSLVMEIEYEGVCPAFLDTSGIVSNERSTVGRAVVASSSSSLAPTTPGPPERSVAEVPVVTDKKAERCPGVEKGEQMDCVAIDEEHGGHEKRSSTSDREKRLASKSCDVREGQNQKRATSSISKAVNHGEDGDEEVVLGGAGKQPGREKAPPSEDGYETTRAVGTSRAAEAVVVTVTVVEPQSAGPSSAGASTFDRDPIRVVDGIRSSTKACLSSAESEVQEDERPTLKMTTCRRQHVHPPPGCQTTGFWPHVVGHSFIVDNIYRVANLLRLAGVASQDSREVLVVNVTLGDWIRLALSRGRCALACTSFMTPDSSLVCQGSTLPFETMASENDLEAENFNDLVSVTILGTTETERTPGVSAKAKLLVDTTKVRRGGPTTLKSTTDYRVEVQQKTREKQSPPDDAKVALAFTNGGPELTKSSSPDIMADSDTVRLPEYALEEKPTPKKSPSQKGASPIRGPDEAVANKGRNLENDIVSKALGVQTGSPQETSLHKCRQRDSSPNPCMPKQWIDTAAMRPGGGEMDAPGETFAVNITREGRCEEMEPALSPAVGSRAQAAGGELNASGMAFDANITHEDLNDEMLLALSRAGELAASGVAFDANAGCEGRPEELESALSLEVGSRPKDAPEKVKFKPARRFDRRHVASTTSKVYGSKEDAPLTSRQGNSSRKEEGGHTESAEDAWEESSTKGNHAGTAHPGSRKGFWLDYGDENAPTPHKPHSQDIMPPQEGRDYSGFVGHSPGQVGLPRPTKEGKEDASIACIEVGDKTGRPQSIRPARPKETAHEHKKRRKEQRRKERKRAKKDKKRERKDRKRKRNTSLDTASARTSQKDAIEIKRNETGLLQNRGGTLRVLSSKFSTSAQKRAEPTQANFPKASVLPAFASSEAFRRHPGASLVAAMERGDRRSSSATSLKLPQPSDVRAAGEIELSAAALAAEETARRSVAGKPERRRVLASRSISSTPEPKQLEIVRKAGNHEQQKLEAPPGDVDRSDGSGVNETKADSRQNGELKSLDISARKEGNQFASLPPIQLLCSEAFLERWGEIISELATGRWTNSLFRNVNKAISGPLPDSDVLGRSIRFKDTCLLDGLSVDVELPGRVGIIVHSFSTYPDDDKAAKAFVAGVVKLASAERYKTVHCVMCINTNLSCAQAQQFVMVQNSFAGAEVSTVVQVHAASLSSLSYSLARIILGTSSLEDMLHYNNMVARLDDDGVSIRATFLAKLLPTISAIGALQCVTDYGQSDGPGDQFQRLLRSKLTRQNMSSTLKSTCAESLNDKPMIQLSHLLPLNLKTVRIDETELS